MAHPFLAGLGHALGAVYHVPVVERVVELVVEGLAVGGAVDLAVRGAGAVASAVASDPGYYDAASGLSDFLGITVAWGYTNAVGAGSSRVIVSASCAGLAGLEAFISLHGAELPQGWRDAALANPGLSIGVGGALGAFYHAVTMR